MKTSAKILVLIFAAAIFAACSSAPKAAPAADTSYNRGSDKSDIEKYLRYKVFAPYRNEGKFYAVYALAKVVKPLDAQGFYTVKFINGPNQGQILKTKDVIVKTAPLAPSSIKKGMVVIYDTANPKDFKNSNMNMWQKAVVYDETEAAQGRVMLEFPRDKSDFFATREACYPSNIRAIIDPVTSDPRTFL